MGRRGQQNQRQATGRQAGADAAASDSSLDGDLLDYLENIYKV
jgi:hypothetical protein